jgi:hypothetical protein
VVPAFGREIRPPLTLPESTAKSYFNNCHQNFFCLSNTEAGFTWNTGLPQEAQRARESAFVSRDSEDSARSIAFMPTWHLSGHVGQQIDERDETAKLKFSTARCCGRVWLVFMYFALGHLLPVN